jgi:hypothetical protein
MTWSYSLTDLANTPKDQIRLLIGDTVSTDQQMQDEEILYHLTQRSTVWGAAAECCRTLQARYSRSVDQTAAGTSISYSQMAKAYGIKAAEFEAKAAAGGAGLPYAGGISVADKINQEQNSDRVEPQFQIGMDDDFYPIGPGGNESDVGDGGGGG